ncbi:MAG: phosphatase [Bacteroidetes bacterium]|nr:phosphatase [Bacteroidota bacterium]
MDKNTQTIYQLFSNAGAEFLSPAEMLKEKFAKVKAFLFDWDGVFNSAFKGEGSSSNFNEADSMGTNLLRFSHFTQKQDLPYIAVISGERNQISFNFSKRECFHGCYYKVADKVHALEHFCKQHNLKPEEICFFFDDVLDLSIAKVCGVRIMVNRDAGLLFKKYVRENKLADYITANNGANYAIREACEMLMGLNGTFEEVIRHRTDYSADYTTYVHRKKMVSTAYFTLQDKIITVDSSI